LIGGEKMTNMGYARNLIMILVKIGKSEKVKRGDCKKLNKIIKKVQQLSLGDSDSMPNCLLGENFHPLVLTSWSDV